jgi:autotransporter-associated beta strand protein
MLIPNWLGKRQPNQKHKNKSAQRKLRKRANLHLEELEPRTLPHFSLGNSFPVLPGPYSVAVADFNGDGKADLAVADYAGSVGFTTGVSILLGNGDGTFKPAQNLILSIAPRFLVAADVNGDGLPDLIGSNFIGVPSGLSHGPDLFVMLGNGDGTFKAPKFYSLSAISPKGTSQSAGGPVAVGDLNGDGHPDLIVAGKYSSTVTVLLGNGDGTFKPPQSFSTGTVAGSLPGTYPDSIALADVNGDGHMDVLTGDYNYSSNTYGNVSVLLGIGTGTFQPVQLVKTPLGRQNSIALADINGDGRMDLISANSQYDIVTVMLGNGDGTFKFSSNLNFANPQETDFVTLADVNGDGRPDLIACQRFTGVLSILFGNGDGTFKAPQNFALGEFLNSVTVADINGDGSPDLVAVRSTFTYSGGFVTVLLNDDAPAWTLQTAQTFPTNANPDAVAVADLNGDGAPDLVVTYAASNVYHPNYTVSVLLGNGNGTFQPPELLTAGKNPDAVAIGDFNSDGRPDLAIANQGSNAVSVFLGNGDGTFQAPKNFAVGSNPASIAVADLNHNGTLDLVVTDSGSDSASVLLGIGNGSFQPAVNYSTGAGSAPDSVAVADINSDNNLDLILADKGTNNVSVLLGTGTGTFGTAQNFAVGTAPVSVKVADLDADGHPDLIVANSGTNSLSILKDNGAGGFQAAVNIPLFITPLALAVADMNGDGRPDLVVSEGNPTSGLNPGIVSVLIGNGTGTFQAPLNIPAGNRPSFLAVADLDGDGTPDVVVANKAYAGSFSVILSIRPTPTHFQVTAPVSPIAGTPFFVTVSARDVAGLVDANFTGTVNLSSSDPKFVYPGPYTFTPADDGRHTFQVSFGTSGFQIVSASNGTIVGTSSQLLVRAGAANKLIFEQQPQGALVGNSLTPAFSVGVLDSFGNLTLSTANVSLTVASGPGTFTTGSTTTVVAVNGVATFSNVAFTAQGTYTITANSAGLTGITSASFQISVATMRTWSGRGTDNLWSDPANWLENVAPIPGDDLFFPDGALRIATGTNNFGSGFSVHSINFTGVAGAYDLLGNSVALGAGVVGNAGSNRIDFSGITLAASQSWNAANSALALSSPISLAGFTLTLDGSLAATGNDALTGIVSGAGSPTGAAIIKNGTSLWLVSGNNTFTGSVTINNGTLAVNNSNSLGAATNAVTVISGSAGSGSLQVFNNISVLQPLAVNGNGNNTSAGAIDIKDITGNDTFGAISLGSAASILSANIGVNTMTLTGAIQNNGFDLSIVGAGGYTTILSSTGSVSGAGHVLNFGSIFSGTGTLNSVLNVNQGTLSPGSAGTPGTLNASDVNFGIGTNFNPILGNSASSLLNSTGSVNLAGSNLSLSFQSGFVPNPGTSYVIIQATGSVNGNFNGLPDGSPLTVGGQRFVIRYINSTASSLHPSAASGRIVIFPVPAPTTTSLFATPNPVLGGQPETFTAIVTSPAAATAGVSSSVITGTVNFFDGGSLIGSAQVVGGAAVFTTTSLAPGVLHSITASFSDPSGNFSSSASAALVLTVSTISVGWQDVQTGHFTAGKDSDIAGMTASGQWWVAVSNGSNFSNQFWGTWPVAMWVDVQTGDFNGDGLTDIAGRNAQTGQWYVAQSTGSSFNTTVWTTWNPNVTWTDVKVGDFNGDGKSDIVGRFLQTGQWFVAQSTGSSFVSSLWATWNPNITWVDVNVGNFAGNKTSDITGRYLQGGSWWTTVSTGSSFNTTLWATWNPNVTWVDVQVGDFNGDHKADITARYSQSGQWWTAVSTGSSFNTSLWATWNPNLDWVDVKVGDFNGDGKADITARWLDTGEWFTGLSTGSAFLTSLWNTWSPAVTWVDVNVGDVKGDGVPDLVGRIQQNGQWWAALSNGSTAFTNQLWTTWAV